MIFFTLRPDTVTHTELQFHLITFQVPDMISAAKKAAVAAEADMEEKEAPAAAGAGGAGGAAGAGGAGGEGKGDDGDAEIRASLLQGKKKMTSFLGQRNRFRYIEGRPTKRDDTAYNMNIDTSGVEAQVISAGDSYFAVPWKSGGGGPVYVGLLDQKGKMDIPADAPVLAGHREAVVCTEFSPFDGRVLATAGDDARIRVWRLPDPSTGGLKETWNAEPGTGEEWRRGEKSGEEWRRGEKRGEEWREEWRFAFIPY